MVVFGQNCSIWANWFYLGKLVLSGQIGSIWAKGGCTWPKLFYLGKLVLFGQMVIVFG